MSAMRKLNRWVLATRVYLALSISALLSVSLMALFDPQSVMNLVQVHLPNTDALSSIRGVYGGVGLTICLTLSYLLVVNPEKGAAFLSVFWGAYAFSRMITMISDGPLGDFGNRWFWIELMLAVFGLVLWQILITHRRKQKFTLNTGF